MSDSNGMSMQDIIKIASQSGPKTDSQLGLSGNRNISQSNASEGLKPISEGTHIQQFTLNGDKKQRIDG